MRSPTEHARGCTWKAGRDARTTRARALHGATHEQACFAGIDRPRTSAVAQDSPGRLLRPASKDANRPGPLDSTAACVPRDRPCFGFLMDGSRRGANDRRSANVCREEKPICTRLVRASARARSVVSTWGAKNGKRGTLERRIAKGRRGRATAGLRELVTRRGATDSVTHSERYGERAASPL